MSKIIEDLETRLRGLPAKKKKDLIYNIYQQLVPGRKTEKRKEGDYQRFSQGGGENLLEFILYIEKKLQLYQMKSRAKRLRGHYCGLYPPKD